MSYIQNNSIFWVDVDKITPNPYQPRREFNEDKLNDLAESIKQYGLLQPLVVTRQEIEKTDGGITTIYELISGERRLRSSKIAGLVQIPVIIRSGEEDERVKLELAIIENLQREDLNPMERANAFYQLAEEFGFKHTEIGKKIGKSREYVSNSIRLMSLPDDIKAALSAGKISEGHARPIMMLKDRPEEQVTLFKEVLHKQLTVRESEAIARRIAYDKVRKKSRSFDPAIVELEDKLAESLGTRVFIEKRPVGGKIMIDFFSNEDLEKILNLINNSKEAILLEEPSEPNVTILTEITEEIPVAVVEEVQSFNVTIPSYGSDAQSSEVENNSGEDMEDTEGEDIYSMEGFTV